MRVTINDEFKGNLQVGAGKPGPVMVMVHEFEGDLQVGAGQPGPAIIPMS